jgi:hypothetical protein
MAALNSRNESHTSDEPIKDLIDTAFNWLAPKAAWNYKSTATDICIWAGMQKPTKADINAASQHVTKKIQCKNNIQQWAQGLAHATAFECYRSRPSVWGLIWNVNILATEYLQTIISKSNNSLLCSVP